MNGAGKKLWGYHPPTDTWIPLQVDINGKIVVDMSAINLGDLGDVRVPAPADQNFLYWDQASGKWTYRILVDADIPAGIARDAEVVIAVSDHAALTTGIHGVGARHIAETSVEDLDLAAHKTRHQDGGDDEISVTALSGMLADPQIPDKLEFFKQLITLISYSWENTDRMTPFTSGSGVSAIHSISWYSIHTGATNNSVARITGDDSLFYHPDAVWNWLLGFKISPRTLQTTYEAWAGLMLTPATPSLTQVHVAWRILNGDLYASCGNGTNGTQVDTGINLVQFEDKELIIRYGTADIKYYVDRVLKATITTNIPTVAHGYLNFYIKNTAAIDRGTYISPWMLKYGID